ncbi:uncharacterized protein RSE6_09259 [Rhynchosporium secalis]|uniref:Uncharacterized protein n=1 Tax=Rhynchosporium secalis TaxID=38038 RepID=A0A1E1MHH0_RHYSE|nr:uncharacterized protein RSE6_09259 [Rhynchosporium secalis]
MVSTKGEETGCCEVSVGILPSGASVVFQESTTYFLRNRSQCSLPLPAEVRAHQHPGQNGPVQFESLNFLVKYGKEITTVEGQCLWLICHFLPSQVQIPEDPEEEFVGEKLSHLSTSMTGFQTNCVQGQIKRQILLDIVFTNDQNPSAGLFASVNIIMYADTPDFVVAIIDSHRSGWYPENWEYCKAVFTAVPDGEWENKYVALFLEGC